MLKEMIRNGIRKDENDFPIDEENFEEAINAVNTSVARTTVPNRVMEILSDDRCINLTAKVQIYFEFDVSTYFINIDQIYIKRCFISKFQSSSFWIIAKAVRNFIDQEGAGLLPVRGAVPDMTADTDRYIALQQM